MENLEKQIKGKREKQLESSLIEDPEKAREEAEAIEDIAGAKIDNLLNSLKAAKALGLKQQFAEIREEIQKSWKEAEVEVETGGKWQDILNDLFLKAKSGSVGKFEVKDFEEYKNFMLFLERKTGQKARLLPHSLWEKFSGLKNSNFLPVGDSDYVFKFETIGGAHGVYLFKFPELAEALRKEAKPSGGKS